MSAPAAQPWAPATPTKRETALAVGLLALLYLWVFPYQAHVNNPNENVRVFMTVAAVDDGTFAINRVERDWGYVNDKSLRQTPLDEVLRRGISHEFLRGLVPDDVLERARRGALTREDRQRAVPLLYSSKAPATSLLGVPAYWALTKLTGRRSTPTPVPGARAGTPPRPPLDRTFIVYWLRLFANVLPALAFAPFFHRFLGRFTSTPALRDAAFFSAMAGSLLFAYNELFASHGPNAWCAAGAFMALATARERERAARAKGATAPGSYGLYFVAGLLGVAVTTFEYPAAMVTAAVGLLVLASSVERRALGAVAFGALGFSAGKLALDGHKKVAVALALAGLVGYAVTLTKRSALRLVSAGLGALVPLAPTLWFHHRAFGSPFKTGYSFIENPVFHQEHSQGFFGATQFSWESAARLWMDPSFGMLTGTPLLLAALPGFGAWLAPRGLDRRVRWALGALCAAGAVFCAVKLGVGAYPHRALNGPWPAGLLEACAWLGWLAVALVGFFAMALRPLPGRDAGLGAGALLAVYLLSRLIGMMNNWRGGWTVGPRYLATLVPLLTVAALVGLEQLADRSSRARRAVTLFAGASTVAALALSGIPSVWFPHVPTDLTSPLFEFFVPLLRAGAVPRNVGQQLWSWQGFGSLWPFALGALGAVALAVRGNERRPAAVAAHTVASLALAMVLLSPFAFVARPEAAPTARWALGLWEPARPRPDRNALAAAPLGTTPAELRTRARALAQAGDATGALEAFRHAAVLEQTRAASAPSATPPR